MCSAIDNLTSCEICAVIHFLHVKNMSVAEIHRELWVVKSQNMSEGTVKDNGIECSKMGEQMFTVKSEVVDRPSVASDDLVQNVDQKICGR
jgi:hypothetical protein